MADSLPDTISLHFADWEQAISFRTSPESVLNLAIFDQLARATAAGRQIRIAYRKPGRCRPETRVVDPYHLASINGEWYLFAYDHLRNDLRTFVPARIQSIEPTGVRFTRPANFSVDKQLRHSFGVLIAGGKYDVVLRFSARVADYIREKRWHPSQTLKDLKDGRVELRMRLSSLVEVQRWILSWAGDVEVAAPRELAESVCKAATAILDMNRQLLARYARGRSGRSV
ncbi:MAG: WYL domain-containing protein [Verrucomicrobiae bacterium]|nr:WYL domain-containing protein [Verrucomicrobiae bacterium]